MITHLCDFSLYLTKASRGDLDEHPTVRSGQVKREVEAGNFPGEIFEQLKAGRTYAFFISDCKGGAQHDVMIIKMNRKAKDSFRGFFPYGWPSWLRCPTMGKGNGVNVHLMRVAACDEGASHNWRELEGYDDLPAIGADVYVACSDGRVCCATHAKKNVFESRLLGSRRISGVTHWHPAVIHPAASGL
jgi:hypothetical protein